MFGRGRQNKQEFTIVRSNDGEALPEGVVDLFRGSKHLDRLVQTKP